MAAIISKTVNDKKYQFFCETWETSRSWGHKCTLFAPNGYCMNTAKVRYYNRTWESYQYQSVAQACIYEYIRQEEDRLIDDWKYTNKRSRIMKNEREALINGSQYIQELRQLYNSL